MSNKKKIEVVNIDYSDAKKIAAWQHKTVAMPKNARQVKSSIGGAFDKTFYNYIIMVGSTPIYYSDVKFTL